MKYIRYYFNIPTNIGTEDSPEWKDTLFLKTNPYSEANEEIAKREAYNGEYSIEDDGIEEVVEPTQLDRVESQVAYLAMMTGYEEILEV